MRLELGFAPRGGRIALVHNRNHGPLKVQRPFYPTPDECHVYVLDPPGAVANTDDQPIQVGSHYHFAETNPALRFDRAAARGMRLDIPAGTAVRFEPGQTREITLVAYAGTRAAYGFRGEVMDQLETQS